MKRNIIGFGLLFVFYTVLGYVVFGVFAQALLFNGLFMVFVVLSSMIPIHVLQNEDIRNNQYQKTNIILAVNSTHIVLVIGFIVFVILYERYLGEISPATGFVVFGLSYVVHFIALSKELRRRWAIIAMVVHTIVFILFINYGQIHFTILAVAFIYMVIQEIFVCSYGILKHIKQL